MSESSENFFYSEADFLDEKYEPRKSTLTKAGVDIIEFRITSEPNQLVGWEIVIEKDINSKTILDIISCMQSVDRPTVKISNNKFIDQDGQIFPDLDNVVIDVDGDEVEGSIAESIVENVRYYLMLRKTDFVHFPAIPEKLQHIKAAIEPRQVVKSKLFEALLDHSDENEVVVNFFPQICKNCPRFHGLKSFTAPKEGLECDDCNKDLSEGENMYACKTCNFALCMNCWTQKDLPPHIPSENEIQNMLPEPVVQYTLKMLTLMMEANQSYYRRFDSVFLKMMETGKKINENEALAIFTKYNELHLNKNRRAGKEGNFPRNRSDFAFMDHLDKFKTHLVDLEEILQKQNKEHERVNFQNEILKENPIYFPDAMEICLVCDGSGTFTDGEKWCQCPSCMGVGKLESDIHEDFDNISLPKSSKDIENNPSNLMAYGYFDAQQSKMFPSGQYVSDMSYMNAISKIQFLFSKCINSKNENTFQIFEEISKYIQMLDDGKEIYEEKKYMNEFEKNELKKKEKNKEQEKIKSLYKVFNHLKLTGDTQYENFTKKSTNGRSYYVTPKSMINKINSLSIEHDVSFENIATLIEIHGNKDYLSESDFHRIFRDNIFYNKIKKQG